MQTQDTYLTGPQVCERYGISQMSLHRWLNRPELGFPKPMTVCRRRYFREADLIDWERRQAGRVA